MPFPKFAFIALLSLTPSLAFSGPATDSMSDCLVKQTTGQDRIDLVRWMMMAFSKHADVKSFVQTDKSVETSIEQNLANLFTDLLTERCVSEAKLAMAQDGVAAFESAFKVLGEVAAFELMRSPDVNRSVAGFTQYLDEARIQEALR